jgi:hypothetical protein
MTGTTPRRIGSGLSAAALMLAVAVGTISSGAEHSNRQTNAVTDTPGRVAIVALKKFEPLSMEADAVKADALGPDNIVKKHVTTVA